MDKVHAILLFRYSVFMLNKINGKVLDLKFTDHFPSHAGDEEEDRQEPVERVGLLHPGGADQGLHGGEPEPQEGERRPLLCQGHDAQVQDQDIFKKANSSLLRDQELVCRENERLLKKLEDVNS